MTQARTAAYGVVTPPPLQHWLNAVLLLCVSLVHRVRTTFGMWRRSRQGDWHTAPETYALPQTKPDIHIKGKSGAASRRLAVDAQRRTPTLTQATNIATPTESFPAFSRESFFVSTTRQKDARVKPAHDTVSGAQRVANHSRPVIPDARAVCEPEPGSVTLGRRHARPRWSRSRFSAPGMTRHVCQLIA